jgi:hypothetical protein
MNVPPRVVETGLDAQGRAVVLADGEAWREGDPNLCGREACPFS